MSFLYKLASLCPSDQSPLSRGAGVDVRDLVGSAQMLVFKQWGVLE